MMWFEIVIVLLCGIVIGSNLRILTAPATVCRDAEIAEVEMDLHVCRQELGKALRELAMCREVAARVVDLEESNAAWKRYARWLAEDNAILLRLGVVKESMRGGVA